MTSYDFRTLSPLDFEELVRDLLQAELGVLFESFKPGKDQGIDFRFASGIGGAIVQAKHYVGSGFAALLRTCRTEDQKVAAIKPLRYLLTTSVRLSPAQKKRLREAMPSASLAEADIFGADDLNNLLDRHQAVERRHFKLWLASAAVLERILHSGVYNRTETEMALIKRMTLKFVQNDSVSAAERILERSGSLIISGEPGVGKTTLARMLVWLHAEQEWNISVIDDIREAFELPLDETKRLIFFDDFLGQVALSRDLIRSTDQRFPPFLQRVRAHKNLRFVLTTRDYILRQAQAYAARLAEPAVNTSEFVLDVSRYTRSVRAKMLYNHLYFSEMSKADLKSLLTHDFYLSIIDHRNFNPRLIDLLTSPDYLAITGKPIRSVVSAVLDNPSELWERPYRTQLGREARALMLALYFNDPVTKLADLEQTFGKMLDAVGSTLSLAERPPVFRNTLKELEGSVLSIQDRKVRFSNPGVRDFLDRVVVEDRFLSPAADVLSDYSELKQCWNTHQKSTDNVAPGFPEAWCGAVERLVQGGSGTALERLELAIDSFEALGEPKLLSQISVAAADVEEAEIGDNEADLCRSLLERVFHSPLPGELAFVVRNAVSNATARLLDLWGGAITLDDLDAIASKLTQFGTDQSKAKAAVHSALRYFIDNIDETLRDYETLDDLEDFEIDLNRLMVRYEYVDPRVARDIEYRRDAILEGRVGRYRSNYGSLEQPDEQPDVSDNEIKSMFKGISH